MRERCFCISSSVVLVKAHLTISVRFVSFHSIPVDLTRALLWTYLCSWLYCWLGFSPYLALLDGVILCLYGSMLLSALIKNTHWISRLVVGSMFDSHESILLTDGYVDKSISAKTAISHIHLYLCALSITLVHTAIGCCFTDSPCVMVTKINSHGDDILVCLLFLSCSA